MKLSELTTKQALSKMLVLIPVVKELTGDMELLELFKKGYSISPDATAEEIEAIKMKVGTEKLMDITAMLIEKHENVIYKILSVMNEREIKEIQEQSIIETFSQIQSLFEDKALMQLFTTQKA